MSSPLLKDMDISLKREINLARNIQTKLLNGTPPVLPQGEVSGISVPARLVGGDYFDFCKLPDGKLRMVIGDVMGKGIPAAMLMILTRGAFRSLSQKAERPSEMLTLINQALFEDLRSLHSFVTLFCADWDPESKKITYSNAGHTPPILISSPTNYKFLEGKGIMIGGLPNQVYEENEVAMEKGECLFFYTDGIIEAQNAMGELFRKERLIELLTRIYSLEVEDIKQTVLQELQSFTKDHYQKDDITMLIFKY
jgi:sigma-B regulation protein RsbU (phosphoserine phosphatase)